MTNLQVRLAGIGLLSLCAIMGAMLPYVGDPEAPSRLSLLGLGLAVATMLSFVAGLAALVHGRAMLANWTGATPAPSSTRRSTLG